MFVAIDSDGIRQSANNTSSTRKYFCPICNQDVIVKAEQSSATRTHFAHKKGSNCTDTWQYDISRWHLAWQEKFPLENREVVVEQNGIKHRADVLIHNTVIEFQHSHISAEEIEQRNNFYLTCGYNIVWVFDVNEKIVNFVNKNHNVIDPMKCPDESSLCWKRKTDIIPEKIPNNIKFFLNYNTTISAKGHEGEAYSILLLVKSGGNKYFTIENTRPYYITPENFLKEYIQSPSISRHSVTELINLAKSNNHK